MSAPARSAHICIIHDEECGEERRAVTHDREFGWLCEECARDILQSRGYERRDSAAYSHACGYHD